MQLKKKDMQSYRQKTELLYPVPKRVQELIPVYRIAKDGVFQIERTGEDGQAQFDKAYLFSDTNFTPMDDREKGEFLKQCSVQIAGDQSEPGYGPGEKGTVFKSRTGVWGAVPVVSDACGGGHAKGPFRDRAVQDLCAVLSEGGRRSGKELFSVD